MAKPFKQTFAGKVMFGDDYPVAVFLRRMFSAGLLAKIGAVAGGVAGAALGWPIGVAAAGGALVLGGVMTAKVLLSRKTVAGANTRREKIAKRVKTSIPFALSTVWVMGTSMLFLPGKKDIFNKNAEKDKPPAATSFALPRPQVHAHTAHYHAA